MGLDQSDDHDSQPGSADNIQEGHILQRPPNARAFRDNVVEMERLMPVVDGVTLYPVTDNGGVVTEALGRLFRPDFHRLEDFDSGVDLMIGAKTRLYRDNFLLVYLTSGIVDLEIPDWLDPEFDAVVNNWKVAAEYAKEAGMRGLLLDDEVYRTVSRRMRHLG